jgi:hypothetical protein
MATIIFCDAAQGEASQGKRKKKSRYSAIRASNAAASQPDTACGSEHRLTLSLSLDTSQTSSLPTHPLRHSKVRLRFPSVPVNRTRIIVDHRCLGVHEYLRCWDVRLKHRLYANLALVSFRPGHLRDPSCVQWRCIRSEGHNAENVVTAITLVISLIASVFFSFSRVKGSPLLSRDASSPTCPHLVA